MMHVKVCYFRQASLCCPACLCEEDFHVFCQQGLQLCESCFRRRNTDTFWGYVESILVAAEE
jgi:hypothetical protein